jgi:16S rRNA A1518/A1519 N6-dimethyltransferase RsmA/KsgA/DIM1 with predicted DNA glycosylase/AP lyase activity
MFDANQFYPTPDHIIEKMIEPFTQYAALVKKGLNEESGRNWYVQKNHLTSGLIVLEPSAGSGAILDYITKNLTNRQDQHYYACEQDPELKATLQGKGYKVVSDDFLELNSDMLYDLIIMNPPFSNGDEHLLHAWEILDKGHIVCLLNEETIINPYSRTRQLLAKIIADNGSVEYLGNCFSDSVRKTDVMVVMVRLEKKSDKTLFDFTFDHQKTKQDFHMDEDTIHNQVAMTDVVTNMIVQLEQMKKSFVGFLEFGEKMKFYSSEITSEYFDPVEYAVKMIKDLKYNGGKRTAYNSFHMTVQGMMWEKVMNHLGIEKYLTSSVRANFKSFLKSQQSMAFCKDNMNKIVQMIFNNRHKILEDCITESFTYLTDYHDDNRLHVEGWKTNEKYKVGKKIILPNLIQWGSSHDTADWKKTYGCNFNIASRHNEYSTNTGISDVEKALDYITGKETLYFKSVMGVLKKRFDSIGRIKSGEDFDKSDMDSFYFNIRFFKKGTVHLTFKDVKVWDEFNMRACLKKNWLPDEEARAYTARKKKEAQAAGTYTQPEVSATVLQLESAEELQAQNLFLELF